MSQAFGLWRTMCPLIAVLVLGAAGGCGSESRAPDSPPGWLQVMARSNIAVAIDTGRIVATDSGHALWIRMDLAESEHLPDEPHMRYQGAIAHAEVNCRERRAQLLRIIVLDSVRDTLANHAQSGPWRRFDEDPFSTPMMASVCRALRRLST